MANHYAAIDCGTNTVRLLLVKERNGKLSEVDRRLVITRLGEGVDASGVLSSEALERTFAALDDFAAQIKEVGGAKLRVVATSAARDARNLGDFVAGVKARLGVEPEIISGEEEATLSYFGAIHGLPKLPKPILVMDIGGGSTELTIGGRKRIKQVTSLDVGSVRLKERILKGDPPAKAEIADAKEFVDSLVDESGLDFSEVYSFVGVGGTVTSLSAIVQGLDEYDREQVHDSVISTDDLRALAARLLTTPIAQIKQIPTMEDGREDVIASGCLIAREVMRFVGLPMRVSEADLLDGVIEGLVNADQEEDAAAAAIIATMAAIV
ncbi:MAG: Ppx/GppA family phosphatase [Propionibacteriaceae bacterium]|jgi:exopolyphosphatase/guanosine-5'-triphosphate,3'-diphosphate pyrophosphatase|nr:Ppx/GppA family phosphatase [Propionibacteriaceae bacterium]